MIGQHLLQSRVEQLVKNRAFPRFSIFVGPKGSGKKTLVRNLKAVFDTWRVSSDYVILYELPDIKIDTIRDAITQSYRQAVTTLYIISDADNMSNAAKNALLKVTEEPPNNAYFVMTLEDENNTLETIRSRGTIFRMSPYKANEIGTYFYDKYHANHGEEEAQIIRDICETPGEVDTVMSYGITEFYDYVQLVVDNIADVSLANAFKIPSKVALKDTDEGYDLRLFWKAFINVVVDRAIITNEPLYAVGVTSKYLQKLRVKGINKQMLIDMWIIDVREVL